ncbi:hypothetical protein B0H10DRAFT_2129091 [Mycena sp. CBHHK59/15]|nr:hypothetical protein B0H10DRAFT_2129091 [Mycena sp. CBHHK59/15]
MPRRAGPRGIDLPGPDARQQSPIHSSSNMSDQNLAQLRTHWKWAAFSQFFYTFAHLFSMEDVSLSDIEDDLVRETNIFLPRVMARLLYVLSYDRKVSLENWQSALRKQHNRRDPASNPIGPEPSTGSPDPHYHYASVSVDNATPAPADDSAADPREGTGAGSDGDFASSEKGESAPALPSGSRENTEGKGSPVPEQDPADKDEQQESKDWLDLPMLTKLDSMHLLTEWQFQNPTRLRTLMKSDDEDATWRIEPIGYDAKSNAYWLIGADRLWIQRVQPKPSRYTATTSPLKRKRAQDAAKLSAEKSKRPSSKRARLADDGPAKVTITVPGGGRAAKAQAKLKLDAQAKELADLNREAGIRAVSRRVTRGRTPVAPVRPLGTRVSARLRGVEEDEWQAVPQDWLTEEQEGGSKARKADAKPRPKTGLESDDESVSDLTELSEEAAGEIKEESSPPADVPMHDDEAQGDDNREAEGQREGFIEWKTICVTLHDWEHIAERFQNGTHYTEKALHKVLVKNIVPIITEELREIERKRHLEEAIVHRKRSSRIANKESEKEEARMLAKQKAEVLEKKTRAQRLVARLAKEDADRERREVAREQRRREKEVQEQPVVEADSESVDMHIDVVGNNSTPIHSNQSSGPSFTVQDKVRRNETANTSSSTSGTRTPAGDDWVLNCEICRRSGVNVDEGVPMLCCGLCSQWQHIACHDHADMQAGRPGRNWDEAEFVCRQCQTRRTSSHNGRQYQQPALPNPYRPQASNVASSSYAPYDHISQSTVGRPQPGDYSGSRSYPVAVNGSATYIQPDMSMLRQLPYPAAARPANYLPTQQTLPQQRPAGASSVVAAYNVPAFQPQHQQPGYDRPTAQFQPIAPHANGHRAPSTYQRPAANTSGWNMPPVAVPYAPSGAALRVDGERHGYGDGGQWHGGGSQQAAAFGYHSGQ